MTINDIDKELMPQHIAIIMDGNRRWAKEKGMDTRFGHKAGAETLEKIAAYGFEFCNQTLYEVEDEPYFGYLRGRYTKAELKELDRAAKENELELIPCIQTLAHLGGIARWPEYANSCFDLNDILFVGEDRTYKLIDGMFATCAECFTSRRINIGMDEAHLVGLGKYLDKHGYENRFEILLKHLRRVSEIAEKYGFSSMMWSDMFFRLANGGEYYCVNNTLPQEVKDLVPKNISLIYWDYYSTDKSHFDAMIKAHKQFDNNIIFACGDSGWYGFAPHNQYAVFACESAIRSCIENDIEDIFVTCWKDDGAECPLFATLPVILSAAEFARGNFNIENIAKKFRRLTGICLENFVALDEVNLNAEKTNNPCKYMLYSDPFLGIFDKTLNVENGGFATVKEKLQIGTKNRKYGYIFRTLKSLCEALEIKYDLGVRTRAVYRKKDCAALKELLRDYKELEKRLKVFYRLFLTQWEKECKPNGFEKHDIRLGGLMQRIRHCHNILSEYLVGKREGISELEEDILPFNKEDDKAILFNNWLYTTQIKPIM